MCLIKININALSKRIWRKMHAIHKIGKQKPLLIKHSGIKLIEWRISFIF